MLWYQSEYNCCGMLITTGMLFLGKTNKNYVGLWQNVLCISEVCDGWNLHTFDDEQPQVSD